MEKPYDNKKKQNERQETSVTPSMNERVQQESFKANAATMG